MHGYLAFDENDTILVPFRTWRNTITEEAASKLTAEFNYNIPQRWSIAHLYQAILNGEEHVPYVDFFKMCIRDRYKAGYRTIDEIGRARIEASAKLVQEETGADIDYGYTHYYIKQLEMILLKKWKNLIQM